MKVRIIDSHVHLGCNRNTKYYGETELWRDLKEAGAQGAVIFAFPEDMYRIADTRGSRTEANEYVLEVAERSPDLFPFYFVWNDYLLPENLDRYQGVKWHRHHDEPRYNYDDPKCHRFLEKIKNPTRQNRFSSFKNSSDSDKASVSSWGGGSPT